MGRSATTVDAGEARQVEPPVERRHCGYGGLVVVHGFGRVGVSRPSGDDVWREWPRYNSLVSRWLCDRPLERRLRIDDAHQCRMHLPRRPPRARRPRRRQTLHARDGRGSLSPRLRHPHPGPRCSWAPQPWRHRARVGRRHHPRRPGLQASPLVLPPVRRVHGDALASRDYDVRGARHHPPGQLARLPRHGGPPQAAHRARASERARRRRRRSVRGAVARQAGRAGGGRFFGRAWRRVGRVHGSGRQGAQAAARVVWLGRSAVQRVRPAQPGDARHAARALRCAGRRLPRRGHQGRGPRAPESAPLVQRRLPPAHGTGPLQPLLHELRPDRGLPPRDRRPP
mmetsp:Transcript_40473/g.108362  ORF Transcript_40473/g.108362 Transcript_40473/m.108362 type:complete len:341 (+) Transcript_40473:262-1284(+)